MANLRESDELSREQKQAILDERAAFLSQVSLSQEKQENQLDLLEIIISGERFAIEARYVKEASKLQNLTPLPCTPAFVLGLVNFRGQILPLIDLREVLELKPSASIKPGQKKQTAAGEQHLQVVVIQTALGQTGIAVDEIVGINSLTEKDLQAPTQLVGSALAPLLKGISIERLAVIDIDKLMSDPRVIVDNSSLASASQRGLV